MAPNACMQLGLVCCAMHGARRVRPGAGVGSRALQKGATTLLAGLAVFIVPCIVMMIQIVFYKLSKRLVRTRVFSGACTG